MVNIMRFHDRYKNFHLFTSIILTTLDHIIGRMMIDIFGNIHELWRPYEIRNPFKYHVLPSVPIQGINSKVTPGCRLCRNEYIQLENISILDSTSCGLVATCQLCGETCCLYIYRYSTLNNRLYGSCRVSRNVDPYLQKYTASRLWLLLLRYSFRMSIRTLIIVPEISCFFFSQYLSANAGLAP
jgi:hypothetical protein